MENNENAVLVPYDKISEASLLGLINDYILREGTDYGVSEIDISIKREQVFKQIKEEKVLIVFDLEEESMNLISKEDLKRLGFS